MCAWLLLVVMHDFRIRKVKNWVVVFGLFISLWILLNSSLSNAFSTIALKMFLGASVALLVLLPFYAVRWMGAGDVKFGVVVGCWFGLSWSLLGVWLGGSLLAGVHALVALKGRTWASSPLFQMMSVRLGQRIPVGWINSSGCSQKSNGETVRVIPYAAYMAFAALYIFFKNDYLLR